MRVPFALICCLLAAIAASCNGEGRRDKSRDVCVIGGGIGGMSMAVFLKDRGYDPIVLEKRPRLGGMCHTVYFDHNGQENHVDTGVISFFNTTAIGVPGWIDIAGFFSRFTEIGPLGFGFDLPTYNADLDDGTVVTPPAADSNEVVRALLNFLSISERYPWIDTLANPPPTIPPELRVSFSDFVAANGLGILVPGLFKAMINSGSTDYTKITALDGIRMLGATMAIRSLLTPQGSFSVNDGCLDLYVGMSEYLGSDNIVLNADVLEIKRPRHEEEDEEEREGEGEGRSSKIRIKAKDSITQKVTHYKCDRLVVGVAPEAANIQLDLDRRERDLFDGLAHHWYYVSAVDVEGPIAQDSGFVLTNYEKDLASTLPPAPTVFMVFRGLGFGPAVWSGNSDSDRTGQQLLRLLQPQMDKIPRSFLTSVAFTRQIEFHKFTPYFKNPTDQYARLHNLQGYRNTYYNGALNTVPSHTHIINYASMLAQQFPAKNASPPPRYTNDTRCDRAELANRYRSRMRGTA